METNNPAARRRSVFLFLAAVLGLAFGALALAPRLVQPTMVRNEMTLRVAVRATGAPSVTPSGRTPTPFVATPTPGITPTPHMPTVEGCQRYTVQPGDTLFTLADRFGIAAVRIALANDLHSDMLAPGQVLVICSLTPQPGSPTPIPPVISPAPIGQVEVLMTLDYPTKIYTRQPQWITLVAKLAEATGPGVRFLPDVERVTRQSPVVIEPAPTPSAEMGMLVAGGKRWLMAQLTGVHVTLRSDPMQEQAMAALVDTQEPLVWQWLFVPLEAGDYLFGLDVFAIDEYRFLEPGGRATVHRTDPRPVWAQNFRVSVDEIFGIPRRWWMLVSGLGVIMNLLLAVVQIAER